MLVWFAGLARLEALMCDWLTVYRDHIFRGGCCSLDVRSAAFHFAAAS